jgi:radical SAM superfamily enzyme YgiQ (UPF0313 family)
MPFPFLLAYTAAVLQQDDVDVVAIDACAERMDRKTYLARVAQASPDLIVAEVSTPSLHEDLRTVQALRDGGYDGDILLGGLHKDLYKPDFLAAHPEIQGTLIGEYELTIRDWVRARASGIPDAPIAGLIHRGRDGRLLDGGRKHSQQGLDAFPWPARELFPMDLYHDLPGGIPAPSVQMWASRGCSFTCNFCAWPQILYGDNEYRIRAADAVADEILAMQEQGYRSVYFDDDTFNLGKKRTQALASAFVDRGINLPWAYMGRADTCDPAQYELLAKSGLQAVKFGVESADTARLRRIGKNLDVDRVRATVAAVHALGIKVHLTFMFGLQGETLESMQRTLDLAYELDPDSAQFTIAVPFPGSRLHDELEAAGRLEGLKFEELDGYRTGVVSTDALEAEQIIAFVHGVHRRWESRPRGPGPAPIIPVAEIGGSNLAVALLARSGDGEWLREALTAVVEQEGPAREILVVAHRGSPELETIAADVCDWATFLDADPDATPQAMASLVVDRCTSAWIATLHSGAVPRPGWLEAVLAATEEHPDVGAVACRLEGDEPSDGGSTTALSMSRWGRILAARPGDGDAVFGVSSTAAIYSRALLEDTAGFDPRLADELADVDLALRALLLGHRAVYAEGPRVRFIGPPVLRFEDRRRDGAPLPSDDEVRAWAAGRVRLLLKSLPREAWSDSGPAVVAELAMDLVRARRHGRSRIAILRGFVDGVREREQTLGERRRSLGRRRASPDWVLGAFAEAEADMSHCSWQRALASITP